MNKGLYEDSITLGNDEANKALLKLDDEIIFIFHTIILLPIKIYCNMMKQYY